MLARPVSVRSKNLSPGSGRCSKRLVQLDEGRAIETAVRETAGAVRPDATEQGSIAGALRRAESDLEIAV